VWGGSAAADACEVCGGDGACLDCAGGAHGGAAEDRCGACDADPANDCAQDCAGVWGGAAALDACGACGGDGAACRGDGCGVHADCAACRVGGCGWCLASASCVEDRPRQCGPGADHVGAAGLRLSCGDELPAVLQPEPQPEPQLLPTEPEPRPEPLREMPRSTSGADVRPPDTVARMAIVVMLWCLIRRPV
jgi:hypothetical protein